jgi:hypothetical protein
MSSADDVGGGEPAAPAPIRSSARPAPANVGGNGGAGAGGGGPASGGGAVSSGGPAGTKPLKLPDLSGGERGSDA